MWRLPGNTCFEKINIYPYIGKKPRQIPSDNLASSACTHQGRWGSRGGGSGLLQARNPIGLLYIPNKLSSSDPVFNRRPPPLSGTQSPSTSGTAYQQKSSSELIFGEDIVSIIHCSSPANAIMLSGGITGERLGPQEFGPRAVLFLDITSLPFLQSFLQVFGPGPWFVLTFLTEKSSSPLIQ